MIDFMDIYKFFIISIGTVIKNLEIFAPDHLKTNETKITLSIKICS